MYTTARPTPASLATRRIGRKVLQADRIANALGLPAYSVQSRRWRIPKVKTRTLAFATLTLIVIASLAVTGVRFQSARVAAADKAAAEALQTKLEAKSLAADACRRKKVEEKADKVGKITYDEMYDHNACDQ